MKNLDKKKRVWLISLIFFITVFAVWGLFYFIISNYISDRTNRQMTQAAGQVIERLGGEFSQIERLTNSLKQNSDINALLNEQDPHEFFAFAGELDGLLDATAFNPDFIDSIILIGKNQNYYRLSGRLGNKACMRLANTIYSLDMPSHLSIELENRRYIGYTDTVTPDGIELSGAIVILVEEERILDLLRAYDQSGQLMAAISAGNEVITANTERLDLFAPDSLHQPMIHSRLGITPYRISVAADEDYLSDSLMYFTVVALITAVIFGIVLLIYTFILNRNISEIEKQKALVFSLKKQINAHFTINTLNTVRLLVERGELDKAETVAMGLTSLVRYAYDREELINIWDEMDVLEDYIFIMNSRYNGKLDAEFDFDDRLMDYYMPRMMLQPIIENSIVHGFKEMDSGCAVSVKAEINNGRVIFTISDNGIGMEAEEISSLNGKIDAGIDSAKGYENIALMNIKKRLQFYFGDSGKLGFTSGSEGGTAVSLIMPMLTETGAAV